MAVLTWKGLNIDRRIDTPNVSVIEFFSIYLLLRTRNRLGWVKQVRRRYKSPKCSVFSLERSPGSDKCVYDLVINCNLLVVFSRPRISWEKNGFSPDAWVERPLLIYLGFGNWLSCSECQYLPGFHRGANRLETWPIFRLQLKSFSSSRRVNIFGD